VRSKPVATILLSLLVTSGCVVVDLGAAGDPLEGTGDAVDLADPYANGDPVNPGDSQGASDADTGDSDESPSVWSMGYYTIWKPQTYPVAAIEWSGLTHIAVAFYIPQSDGSLSLMGGNTQVAQDIVDAAHSHSVLAIASIGGASSETGFKEATSVPNRATFIANLVGLLDDVGYDGIDIDWEPLDYTDELITVDIANQIRTVRPSVVMTMAIGKINVNLPPDLSNHAAMAAAYDQMNIMSYGMAGAWSGWKSWHTSPLYHSGSSTPMSIDSSVNKYLEAGVPAEKLGIGIGFFGLCYSPPVTGPSQPLNGSTILASDATMSVENILTNYYSDDARLWDSLALVPYLSFATAHGPQGCTYVSYDDEQSIREKGDYLKSKGLGGVIIWEINEGYVSSAPADQRSPFLLAIGDHVLQ
jgi:chitinase